MGAKVSRLSRRSSSDKKPPGSGLDVPLSKVTVAPNLYVPALPPALLKQATSDPFGSITLWTYFNNALALATQEIPSTSLSDEDLVEAGQIDLVYAAVLAGRDTLSKIREKDLVYLIKLLNRCVLSDHDLVVGAMMTMQEETAISPAEEPQILQVLVSVAIKHHNYDVLKKLPPYKGSSPSLFALSVSATSRWVTASKPMAGIWTALVDGGWIRSPDFTKLPASDDKGIVDEALEVDLKESFGPGSILAAMVTDRPSVHLRSYFPLISRLVYDGIPPHHKWPGDPFLAKKASARTDDDGVEILRLLVEVGGMNINDSETWWKPGDHDPREWNPQNLDSSDCTETPLHIAVDTGNLAMIEYILSRGALPIKDGFGRTQLDRAILRKRPAVIDLFRKFGW